MRIVELSNHPGEKLREERERLWKESYRRFEEQSERIRQTNQEARKAFEVELVDHEARVERLRAERDALSGSLHWWKRLRSTARLSKVEGKAPCLPVPFSEPRPPSQLSDRPILTDEEAKLAAGIEGEERVANALSEALGDEWTLLRGYRNRRGEIDQLLLGPAGLIAVEIKNHNATVYVNGDDWRFKRFDSYDNLVKEGVMAAGGGRSPSQQLREPTTELEEFLAKRGQPIAIDPVVVLSHPRGRIGHTENLTVTVAYEPEYIVELIDAWDVRLPPERLPIIERLIVKDHEFHAQRLRARGQSSSRS